ncbi:hypothetical protein SHD_0176, partial [Shewanella decolorationis S12]
CANSGRARKVIKDSARAEWGSRKINILVMKRLLAKRVIK